METPTKKNLKRKRGDGAKEDLGTRILGKMHHELHEVHHACKKAKTFETQKLVKRLKQLRQEGDDQAAIKDHEAQLESIKAIDHNLLANTAFKSKLLKDKQLKENQLFKDALAKEIQKVLEPPETGTAKAKVQSRLLSNKIIASQVASSVAAIKQIINPVAPPAKKARSESPGSAAPSTKPSKARKGVKPLMAKDDDDESSDETSSGDAEDDGDAGDAGWESGTVDDDDDSDDEEASGDGEADGWESGSIHGSDSGPEDDDSGDSDDSSNEELAVKAPQKKAAKTTAAASSKSKAESTFLPSLSMGYIDADSDASDIEEGPAVAEPRKNRRGQRARRAIWEKKYGKGANHMKKEAQMEQERKAKAKAKADSRKPLPRPDSGWGNRKSSAAPSQSQRSFKAPEPPKKQNADKALHPSWEAKRKLKEKEGAAIVPSQGKKITF